MTSNVFLSDRTNETEFIVDDSILYPLEYYILDCIDAGLYKLRIIIKGLNLSYLYEYIVNSNKNPEVYNLLRRFDMTILFDLSTFGGEKSKKSEFRKMMEMKTIQKIILFVRSDECKFIFKFIITNDVAEYIHG